jgi:hypothetical protein
MEIFYPVIGYNNDSSSKVKFDVSFTFEDYGLRERIGDDGFVVREFGKSQLIRASLNSDFSETTVEKIRNLIDDWLRENGGDDEIYRQWFPDNCAHA